MQKQKITQAMDSMQKKFNKKNFHFFASITKMASLLHRYGNMTRDRTEGPERRHYMWWFGKWWRCFRKDSLTIHFVF